jgi:hypothetical protein
MQAAVISRLSAAHSAQRNFVRSQPFVYFAYLQRTWPSDINVNESSIVPDHSGVFATKPL